MPKFNVGDAVWVANFSPLKTILVPCSICDSKRVVTLILGNGNRVEIPCTYCDREQTPGYNVEYRADSNPEYAIIDSMQIHITDKEKNTEYYCGNHVYKEEDLFASKEGARRRSEEKKDIYLKEREKRTDYLIQDAKKSFAWNTGYHMREAKRLRKQAEYHETNYKLCKERSKNDGKSL